MTPFRQCDDRGYDSRRNPVDLDWSTWLCDVNKTPRVCMTHFLPARAEQRRYRVTTVSTCKLLCNKASKQLLIFQSIVKHISIISYKITKDHGAVVYTSTCPCIVYNRRHYRLFISAMVLLFLLACVLSTSYQTDMLSRLQSSIQLVYEVILTFSHLLKTFSYHRKLSKTSRNISFLPSL